MQDAQALSLFLLEEIVSIKNGGEPGTGDYIIMACAIQQQIQQIHMLACVLMLMIFCCFCNML